MDSELIKILRCPLTHSSLEVASEELLKKLNQQIDAGELTNRAGQAVTESIESGLVNEDQSLLMCVRKGIAIMVADQAIELPADSE